MMPSIVLTVGLDQAIFDLGFDFAFSFGASVSASRESWGGGGLFDHFNLLRTGFAEKEPSAWERVGTPRVNGIVATRIMYMRTRSVGARPETGQRRRPRAAGHGSDRLAAGRERR